MGYFWPILFTFSTKSPGKRHKKSFGTSHLHTYTYFTQLTFFALTILQKLRIIMYGFSLVRLLMVILIRAILEQSIITKWWAKFKLECLLLIFISTNTKFKVICKPRTLNDGRWRLISIQKTQKALLLVLAAAILLFIGKIIPCIT